MKKLLIPVVVSVSLVFSASTSFASRGSSYQIPDGRSKVVEINDRQYREPVKGLRERDEDRPQTVSDDVYCNKPSKDMMDKKSDKREHEEKDKKDTVSDNVYKGKINKDDPLYLELKDLNGQLNDLRKQEVGVIKEISTEDRNLNKVKVEIAKQFRDEIQKTFSSFQDELKALNTEYQPVLKQRIDLSRKLIQAKFKRDTATVADLTQQIKDLQPKTDEYNAKAKEIYTKISDAYTTAREAFISKYQDDATLKDLTQQIADKTSDIRDLKSELNSSLRDFAIALRKGDLQGAITALQTAQSIETDTITALNDLVALKKQLTDAYTAISGVTVQAPTTPATTPAPTTTTLENEFQKV